MRYAALVILTALFLLESKINAHHGYDRFFTDRTVTIEGIIQSIRWANPHVVLQLRTADSTIYTAAFHQGASWFEKRDSGPPSGPAASQDSSVSYVPLNRRSLKVGDHVVVVAAPARDKAVHEVALIKEVRRSRDGWGWKRP